MAVVFSLPRAVRGPLTADIPATVVPIGISVVSLRVDRFAWPEGADIATLSLEYSLDGGNTWPFGLQGKAAGGVAPKGDISAFQFQLPESGNSARRIRGSVTLAAALDCSVQVEAS